MLINGVTARFHSILIKGIVPLTFQPKILTSWYFSDYLVCCEPGKSDWCVDGFFVYILNVCSEHYVLKIQLNPDYYENIIFEILKKGPVRF